MVVLDESKESFILNVQYVEEVEAKLREEERKRTGRYLAVTVVLFLVGLGLYHIVSNVASKLSALISAAMIMLFYLLWLLYASQRRKHHQKRVDLDVEKEVSTVLENLNNMKTLHQPTRGPHDNYVYTSSEEETDVNSAKNDVKLKKENKANCSQNNDFAEYCNINLKKEKANSNNSSRKSSGSSEVFIRTYSIA